MSGECFDCGHAICVCGEAISASSAAQSAIPAAEIEALIVKLRERGHDYQSGNYSGSALAEGSVMLEIADELESLLAAHARTPQKEDQ